MDSGPDKMSVTPLHPSILRAYDIRGVVGETLTAVDAAMIGRCFAHIMNERNLGRQVVVGRDGRLSSPELAKALIQGLVDGGAHVTDIGCGPTPMLYFAAKELAADGAIQVTGSHNPPSHNGFKMVMQGASFFGSDIADMGAKIARGVPTTTGGKVETVDILETYVDRLLKNAKVEGLSVVWDCGNGASGPATQAVVNRLDGTHHVLFADIDGTFPNHHPNPVDPETLQILRNEVKARRDGDRIGIIDAKGRQVPGDLLTAYLAKDVATRHPGKVMLLDVKSSQLAVDLINGVGADARIWKTGHSHMKKKMAELAAPLAGEMSGHIFIADDYFGFDDAIYVAIRVISQMTRTGESITAFMDTLPSQHATPELRIDCPDDQKFDVIDQLSSHVTSRHGEENINKIDGVRVKTDTGWWLVRASNTEAALVARAEANDATALKSLINEIEDALAFAGLKIDFR